MNNPRQIAEAFLELYRENPTQGKALVEKFVTFLQANNLLRMAPEITHYIQENLEREEAEFSLHIESAFSLSSEFESQMRTLFSLDDDEKIIFTENKDLIGGFKARRAGVQYNASIAHKLLQMKIALQR